MVKILSNLLICWLFYSAVALPRKSSENSKPKTDVGEYGDYFEGDMRLDEEQMDDLFSLERNGIISTKYHWPDRTIPYRLTHKHTKKQRNFIELALSKIASVSCLKFVRQTNEKNYIEITAEDSGCHSAVGFKNKIQTLNLQPSKIGRGCFKLGTIIHEFLHALGFHHMQCTYDRDDYVKIHYENIKPGHEHNFKKYTNKDVTHFGTTYDYDSIMHYSAYGFSKNKKPTIVPKNASKIKVIGQRVKMSKTDIYKLNAMYKCDKIMKKTKRS